MNKPVQLPVPPVLVPTSAPLTSFSCEPSFVPHMITQFESGLTLSPLLRVFQLL